MFGQNICDETVDKEGVWVKSKVVIGNLRYWKAHDRFDGKIRQGC